MKLNQLCQNNQIMFAVGSWHYWLTLGQYVSQVSALIWPSVNQQADTQPVDSQQLAKCWLSLVSVKCQLGISWCVGLKCISPMSVQQQITHTWSMTCMINSCPILNLHLTDCWLTNIIISWLSIGQICCCCCRWIVADSIDRNLNPNNLLYRVLQFPRCHYHNWLEHVELLIIKNT